MSNKIIVSMNNFLQKPVDKFIDFIKENLDIDVNNQLIADKDIDKYEQLADEFFDEYEVYNKDLFEIAGHLYDKGYDALHKAVTENDASPLLINQLLEEFVLDLVAEHQATLLAEQTITKEETKGLNQ